MDELRQVAWAYYNRSNNEFRESATNFFRSMDKNGDGKISLQEYKEKENKWDPNGNHFKLLDANGDGSLDFNEFLAHNLIYKADLLQCRCCLALLTGNYFSCLRCLGKKTTENPNSAFDLCVKCYAGAKCTHQHSADNFMDSHARHKLLRELMSKAEITEGNAGELVRAFNTGYSFGTAMVHIGNFAVAAGCSIM